MPRGWFMSAAVPTPFTKPDAVPEAPPPTKVAVARVATLIVRTLLLPASDTYTVEHAALTSTPTMLLKRALVPTLFTMPVALPGANPPASVVTVAVATSTRLTFETLPTRNSDPEHSTIPLGFKKSAPVPTPLV